MLISRGNNKITVDKAGAKGHMIAKISSIVSTPHGFVITTKVFDKFVVKNNIKSGIGNILDEFTKNKISAKRAASTIKTLFKSAKLDNSILQKINEYITSLNGKLAIRSSANVEDSVDLSFAGIFDSFINIKKKDIAKKIVGVYTSLFSSRSLEYMRQNSIQLKKAKMAVLIQEMVRGDKFGVAFYYINNKKPTYIIEATLKNPEGVTKGNKNTDTYVIQDTVIKYPKTLTCNILFDFEIQKIKDTINKIKKVISPFDMEWAIKNDGTIVILQVRPLTKKVPIPKANLKLGALPASPGKISGIATLYKGINTKAAIDRILFAEEIPLEEINIIKRFGGLVTEIGGLTNHAAIISRELHIPCITGLNGITKLIKDGEKVEIDGDIGNIKFLERESPKIERTYVVHGINPKGLSVFRSNKNAVILYKEADHIIVSYLPQQDKIIQNILIQIKQKFDKPLVDGGEDFFSYKRIIEMSALNKELKKDWMYAIDTVSSNFYISQVSRIIHEYLRKAAMFLSFAESNMVEYKKKNSKNVLISAFENSLFAFSYWRIINNYVLSTGFDAYIYKENSPKIEKLKGLLSHQLTDKRFIRITKEVSTNITLVLDTIKKEFGPEYTYKNYTSDTAMLNTLRKLSQ